MKSTDRPSLIETVIASAAGASYVRTIPKEQTEAGSGALSLALGWPPECAMPVAAGGKYPHMADANGVLNLLSAAVQQLQARFLGPYNAGFATAIGGYPLNAIVSDTTAGKFWVSTAEDNTTVPGASGASWQDLFTGYVKKSGDTMTGALNVSTSSGAVIASGNLCAVYSSAANAWVNTYVDDSGNATWDLNGGYPSNSAGNKNWFRMHPDGRLYTGKGTVAFQSDLSGYIANINIGISGAISGTSLCVNPSDGRAYFAYGSNAKIGTLAWYADVTAETTARVNADNNLQEQVSTKLDSSFVASGLFDGSQGSTTSGKIVGGTWMRVGNTLTQNLVIENIGGGNVTFPFAFSGNANQVTVIVQDGTGSNNSYTTGSITTTGTGIHASGGGGTGRLHLTVSGPYGT